MGAGKSKNHLRANLEAGDTALMSNDVDEKKSYRTKEMCGLAGISRSTYLRWVKEGILQDVKQWDRRGWRLFTPEDINRIKKEAGRVASRK